MFIFCACLSVVLLIVSNLTATKLWDFFGVAMLDGGILSFPLAFVLSDVILEIWGKRKAQYVVWCGFLMNLILVGFLVAVQMLPAGAEWEHQAAYEAILGFMPRIVLGSLVAYLVAQLLNIVVFVKIRERTGVRLLWLRSLGSSVVANLVNSLVFCGIVFGGVISMGEWWAMVGVSCGLMILGEIILTPITYYAVKKMRKLVLGQG